MFSHLRNSVRRLRHSGLALVGAGATASLLSASPAEAALKWNFTLNYSNGTSASGFFYTPGSAFTPNQSYNITSIEGSQSGTAITGLSPRRVATESATTDNTPSNSFFWDSSNTVQSTFQGIAFNLGSNDPDNGGAIMMVLADGSAPGTFAQVNGWQYSYGNTNAGAVISNSPGGVSTTFLTPNSIITETVPGPLPLLGAAGAFGWSRRMRRKLITAKAQQQQACTK
jgi:hypothetical protein